MQVKKTFQQQPAYWKTYYYRSFVVEQYEYEEDNRLNKSFVSEYNTCTFEKTKRMKRRNNSLVIAHQSEINQIEGQTQKTKNKVSIEDFEIIQGLSSGNYGKVCLVQKISSKDHFALKMIDRKKTIEKKEEAYIMSEVEILRNLDNDFIVKLYYSFKDDEYLYFVMDYMNGGDLGNLLQNIGIIEEKFAKLYMAEIVSAFEYIHSVNIIHRDLKPENILIDSTGHLKLTDFGLSQGKLEGDHKNWMTNYVWGNETTDVDRELKKKEEGFVGTPYYLAPEVLKGGKATYLSDWWAVGVIMFEMMNGETPYSGSTPAEIFDNILKDNKYIEMEVGYNDDQISPEAASLIQGLLNHDPEKRLGKNGAKEIKSHPFFEGVNWDTLRKQEPPFVPEAQDITDTSYFAAKKKFNVKEVKKPKTSLVEEILKGQQKRHGSIMLNLNFDTTNEDSLKKKNINAYNILKASRNQKKSKIIEFSRSTFF